MLKKLKGFARRRRYQCSQCLEEIWEYPGLIIDSFALWCEDCQRKEEERHDIDREDRPMLNNTIYIIRLDGVVVARYGCALKKEAEEEFARLQQLTAGTASKVSLANEPRGN